MTRARPETAPRLLEVEAARAHMLSAVAAPGPDDAEWLPLEDALGRVLAADRAAALTMPRWPNSAMDGYALRHAEAAAAGETGLAVSRTIPAGGEPGSLQPGTAARIFTGAPIPAGADTVVVQEHCRARRGGIAIDRMPDEGANIRAGGEDFREGQTILQAGRVLEPQHVGLAASAGIARVAVHRRPRIAIVVTGDELIPCDRAPGPGQIHESNGPMLSALAKRVGGVAGPVRHAPDDRAATRRALAAAAAEADLVVTSGGVSVGDHDHVRPAVESLGELSLFGIAIKPGKPVAFGRIGRTPLLALPGNPVSLFVTFALFGAPLVRRLQGRQVVLPPSLPLPAGFERNRPQSRAEYLRVRLDGDVLLPHARQGSGILSVTAAADGLACVPPCATVARGDRLAYYPFDSLLW